MKIYNIRLNTILTSGRFSELALVIVSLNGLPQIVQMASPRPPVEGLPSTNKWPAPFGRLPKEWTPVIRNEYNTMSMNIQ